MRLIGTLPSETDAVRLGDYLVSIGMPNRVDPGRDGAWELWIEHDDQVEQGQLRLREFLASPNDPRYLSARAQAKVVRLEYERAALRRRKNFTDVRTDWADVKRFSTPVTMAVVALCVAVFLLQQSRYADSVARWLLFYTPLWLRQPTMDDLLQRVGLVTAKASSAFSFQDAFALVARGQLWRLITPTLMHANIGHIVFNVLAFVQVGTMIESRKGARVMLPLVLLGAVLSCVAQASWDAITPGGGMGFVGLSGVVYSVFGYAWVRGKLAPTERVGLNQQTVGMMLAWLVLCMFGVLGPIANAAHVVGLLVGVAVGYAPRLRRKIGIR